MLYQSSVAVLCQPPTSLAPLAPLTVSQPLASSLTALLPSAQISSRRFPIRHFSQQGLILTSSLSDLQSSPTYVTGLQRGSTFTSRLLLTSRCYNFAIGPLHCLKSAYVYAAGFLPGPQKGPAFTTSVTHLLSFWAILHTDHNHLVVLIPDLPCSSIYVSCHLVNIQCGSAHLSSLLVILTNFAYLVVLLPGLQSYSTHLSSFLVTLKTCSAFQFCP